MVLKLGLSDGLNQNLADLELELDRVDFYFFY
jgi:hypothetical protein